MKKILFILVITLLLKPILPVVDYIVNYDYIAKVLCENKAKPELKCNGKCHLMKELAKAAEQEKPISSDKKTNSKQEVEVLFCQEIKAFKSEQICFPIKITSKDNYTNLYSHLNSCSVFHPPTYIS